MTCAKLFEMTIVDGVPWQNLLWGSATILDAGTGTSSFFPTNAESDSWFAEASAPHGANVGRRYCIGSLVYAGPNKNCRVVMVIATNSVAAPPGVCRVTLTVDRNGIGVASYTGPVRGFSGTVNVDFTVTPGTWNITAEVISSGPAAPQPDPMTINCSGSVINL